MALGHLSDTTREDVTLFRGIPYPKEGVHCTLQIALHCKKSSHVECLICIPLVPIPDIAISCVCGYDQ